MKRKPGPATSAAENSKQMPLSPDYEDAAMTSTAALGDAGELVEKMCDECGKPSKHQPEPMPLCPRCKNETELHSTVDHKEKTRICDEWGRKF